ncbi:MAG: carboxypeptidase regulatory-like domain-containing protein, partial [Gammaproteobacteria bacterium]|nr:carboxypeptidase regulatory-like domain-containing protein [Gammaproteobacteria bacterium]
MVAIAAIFSTPLLAQQTGEITGRVTDASDGSAIFEVAVEATSPVLPGMRTSTTSDNGDYKLPALPPGTYTLKFTLSDATTRTRVTNVLLQQRTVVNLPVDFAASAGVLEEVIVVGTSTIAPETGGASLAGAIGTDVFDALPVGQEYRDLIKLIPGVQYTQDAVRGPSAGGSGQDNTYQFDGVDVSLPMYGTLSAEPSTHDIDQVSIVRGGAKAIGFNRSAGFRVNTTSKRGTDEWHGGASYQREDASLTADRQNTDEEFDQDKDWTIASLSGPIIPEKLYFYASYYRPTVKRGNRDNAYGPVPNYESTRDEYFGKLTWAPTENLLFDASYRTSDRTVTGSGVSTFESADGSEGSENGLDITIIEGSWIVNDNSNAYFKYTDFANKSTSRPDLILDAQPAVGASLDLNNLDRMGHFQVPIVDASDPVQAAWAQDLINRYGYIENGVAQGGGLV